MSLPQLQSASSEIGAAVMCGAEDSVHDHDQDIKVLCFTWNVGNKMPDQSQLSQWLPEEGLAKWDIIAVGTQECAFNAKEKKKDKSKKGKKTLKAGDFAETSVDDAAMRPSVAMDAADDDEAEDEDLSGKGAKRNSIEKDAAVWDRMVAKRLGKGYTVVKHVALWQMRLTVYAKAQYYRGVHAKIHHVQSAKSATGVGGVLGNKGGLVVRLDFGQTSLGFCSCHLAAHAHKLSSRNQNCMEILRETEHEVGVPRLDFAHQFDHVFWMGDLNYRTDLNLAAAQEHIKLGVAVPPPGPYGDGKPGGGDDDKQHQAATHRMIEATDWPSLYKADQLHISQENGDGFVGFSEGDLNFPPTFKVLRKDGLEYKTQRTPSYCDRVLWKSMPPLKTLLELTNYTALPSVTTSDHKPVLAEFLIQPSESIFQLAMAHRGASAMLHGAENLMSGAVNLVTHSPRIFTPRSGRDNSRRDDTTSANGSRREATNEMEVGVDSSAGAAAAPSRRGKTKARNRGKEDAPLVRITSLGARVHLCTLSPSASSSHKPAHPSLPLSSCLACPSHSVIQPDGHGCWRRFRPILHLLHQPPRPTLRPEARAGHNGQASTSARHQKGRGDEQEPRFFDDCRSRRPSERDSGRERTGKPDKRGKRGVRLVRRSWWWRRAEGQCGGCRPWRQWRRPAQARGAAIDC